MRLKFTADDDDEYHEARERLVSRFGAWGSLGDADPSDAALLLDWKFGYSDGDLSNWQLDDLSEFFLDWCPRKLSMPASMAPGVIESARKFFAFLVAENLMSRRSAPLATIDRHIVKLGPNFSAAMADTRQFGMAKSMFAGLDALGGDFDLSDPEALQALMDKYNSLSFEERSELMGFSDGPSDPWHELTYGLDMPPATRRMTDGLAAELADHGLTNSIKQLREFVGVGRKLTAKGNLTVADAKALAVHLGVDEHTLGDDAPNPVRSADDLPTLQYRVRLARACGATKVAKGRLTTTATWGKLKPEAAVTKVVTTLLNTGPLELSTIDGYWTPHAIHDILDEGVPHLLAILWSMGQEPVEFEELAEAAHEVCSTIAQRGPMAIPSARAMQVRSAFSRLIGLLEDAGVVIRSGTETVTDGYGFARLGGGELTLTDLARHALGGYLTAAGYNIPVVGELAHGDLAVILDHVDDWHADRVRAEFDAWVDAHSGDTAGDELTRILAVTPEPTIRMATMDLIGRLTPSAGERAARQLLDTPARGHAIAWLLANGHDDVEIDHDAMLLAALDALECELDNPEGFLQAMSAIDDPSGFIDTIWRLNSPAVGEILDALGRLHPVASVAKHARKTLLRHRSFLANLR